jgi:CRISPR/Cas system-associated exonuclease Cas4 (RecB family)
LVNVTKNYTLHMNLDAYKLPIFTIKKWEYLTPSKFTAARACAWREVLSASVGRQLLPTSPAAWLGSVIHALIENIVNGIITNETDFDTAWRENVMRKETELVAEGRDAWLRLSATIPRFAFKKLQTKAFLKNHIARKNLSLPLKNNSTEPIDVVFLKGEAQQRLIDSPKLIAEQKLVAREGWLLGKADLVVETHQHVHIVDYKTGQIFDDSDNLKEDYRAQLLLYAWLYADINDGKYPNRLTILDLNQTAHDVEFTPIDCEKYAAEARQLLQRINNAIENQQFATLAKPNEDNCSFCSMRPVCSYKSHQLAQNWIDTEGSIENIGVSKNGETVQLNILYNDGKRLSINAIPIFWQTIINGKVGQKIHLFNLQKTENSAFFKWHRQSSIFFT